MTPARAQKTYPTLADAARIINRRLWPRDIPGSSWDSARWYRERYPGLSIWV